MFRKISQLIRKLSGYPLRYRVILFWEDHCRFIGLFNSNVEAEGWLSDNLLKLATQPSSIFVKGEY